MNKRSGLAHGASPYECRWSQARRLSQPLGTGCEGGILLATKRCSGTMVDRGIALSSSIVNAITRHTPQCLAPLKYN